MHKLLVKMTGKCDNLFTMFSENKQTGFSKGFVMGIITIGLIVTGLILYQSGRNSAYNDLNIESEMEVQEISLEEESTMTLMIPFIDSDGGMQAMEEYNQAHPLPQSWYDNGTYVGCGSRVVYVPTELPASPAVLNATYEYLITASTNVTYQNEEYYNPIGWRSTTAYPLGFDSVELIGSTARIYFTGNIIGNHCGDPSFLAQVRFAATQYPTVDDIEIYLNEEPFDIQAWLSADAGEGE